MRSGHRSAVVIALEQITAGLLQVGSSFSSLADELDAEVPAKVMAFIRAWQRGSSVAGCDQRPVDLDESDADVDKPRDLQTEICGSEPGSVERGGDDSR